MTFVECLHYLAVDPKGRSKYHVATPPPDYVVVPVHAPTWTPLTALLTDPHQKLFDHPAAWADAMANARKAFASAGRADEDIRASFWRWMLESGWGRAVWCHNVGNVKSRPFVESRDEFLKPVPYVATGAAHATLEWALQDMEQSVDLYAGFDSLIGYAFFEREFLNAHYPTVVDAYRLGGRDGCVRGSHELARLGYSGDGSAESIAKAEHEAGWYWDRAAEKLGTAFVR